MSSWSFVSLIFGFICLVLFDVGYFLRVIATIAFGRLFEKKHKITDPTTIYGLCFTQDIDIACRHMNNARFVRDLDFARFHFYDRTGIYAEMLRLRVDALQAATNIRYRRVIPFLTPYKITSQVIWWDDKSIYVEQKFVTRDGFVRAIVLSKQTLPKVDVEELMVRMGAGPKPQLPQDLDFWLKSMEVSSQKLRPKSD